MVVAPADNVATRIIVQVQTATTKVKRLITKAVMENWTQEDLVRELNKTIANEDASRQAQPPLLFRL